MPLFTEFQNRMAEQSKGFTPEAWAQFMPGQQPLAGGLMGSYMEQSQQMLTQMQKQTAQMLGAFGLKKP